MQILKDGYRVRLVRTSDPYTQLKPGATGTVWGKDDAGDLLVDWDDGSSLSLVPRRDAWEKLDQE